jgi:diguanylate cyclase (GGDEF)-like protein
MLVDETTHELVIVEQCGYPEETLGLRLPLSGERGLSRWVAEHGTTLYVPDVLEDARYIPGVPEARSELAVPIRIRNKTIGVINVESEHVDAFDRDGALLLEALASQLAVALELHRVRSELERLTYTDALTGVFNRRYLEHVLPAEKERAERFDHAIGLLMVDLDGFKEVNDKYGHDRGDVVLIAFAEALRRIVRRIDIVIRYGGDEFLILLIETDEDGAKGASVRIRDSIERELSASPAVPEDCELHVSVGMSVRCPGEDVAAKVREADRAMYADKQRGAAMQRRAGDHARAPLAEAP